MLGRGAALLVRAARSRTRPAFLVALVALAFSAMPSSVWAEQLRVRIAWGEGWSRQWRSVVRVQQGKILEARGLGLAVDAPGATNISPSGQSLEIVEPSPNNYNGVDVLLDAPLDAEVSIELSSGNGPPKRFAATLGEIATDGFRKDVSLDENRNRVVLQRSPGDQLRFESTYKSMVFTSGETVRFQIKPHLITSDSNGKVDCRVRLLQGGEEVSSQVRPITLDANGSARPIAFEFPMPQVEGVFEFECSLSQKPRVQWLAGKQITSRRVQLVAIDPQPPISDHRDWEQVDSLEPAKKAWFNLAQLPGIPGLQLKPINRDATRIKTIDGRETTELPAKQWVAYPLSIPPDRLHSPHILEIEYPTSAAQSFSLSVVEPDRANHVTTPSVDSGVVVSDRWAEVATKMERHRVLFWPRTSTPFVVIANRSPLRTAQFGTIRVYAGPLRIDENSTSLEPNFISPYNQDRTAVLDERTVAAFFSRPLFAENFGSDRAADPARLNGSLDDWYKFYRGASRLAQYIRYAGFNSAVVCVAREGGAIYPSKVLEPTPRFDNGVFFRSGQDPIRKDVLEMMFRIFDREGLKLIPALHLSGTTPRLERLRLDRANGEGVALVNRQGGSRYDGQNRLGSPPPFYNAIDPRVQAETKRIVREVIERYADHASFGGIALQSGADTWTQFPDEFWGVDGRTVRRFMAETSQGDNKADARLDKSIDRILDKPDERFSWMRWRASLLSRLHREIETEVERSKPGTNFIITTESMFQSPQLRADLSPRATRADTLAQRLLRVGHDVRMPRLPGNELLRAYHASDESNIATHAENVTLNQPSTNDGIHGGALFTQEHSHLAMSAFNDLSPFADAKTDLRLNSTFTPSGLGNRRRYAHAMSGLDPFVTLDGGDAIAMGQEYALRPYLRLLRSIPAQPFENVPGATRPDSSVVVRQHRSATGATTLYAFNQAPWEVDLEVLLDGLLQSATRSIQGVEAGSVQGTTMPNQLAWRVQLAPFGVAAIILPPGSNPTRWTNAEPPRIAARLGRRIQDIENRMAPPNLPRRGNGLPPNLSFENPGPGIPNWRFPPKNSKFLSKIEQDGPSRVLHLTNDDGPKTVLWSRSDQFPAPATGMIAVEVRLRTKPGAQPRLAVAIDELSGQNGYYVPLFVGRGTPQPVGAAWQDYPFRFKLPPGLDKIAIGFDLHGKGEIWIDDIRVYDIWLEKREQTPLAAQANAAKGDLAGGNPFGAQRFLEGYWPRFLQQHDPTRKPQAARAEKPRPNPLLKLLPRL